jgi:hypothetical protein
MSQEMRCDMHEFFTTREGAIRRLIGLQRESLHSGRPAPTVIGKRKDGAEVRGLINALADFRTGRLECYRHSSPADEHIVFIS